MQKTFLKLIAITICIFFLSCENVIQIKLDEGSKLYVVDAFVNNLRKNQVIKLTTNDSYFSNREAPPVTGATVLLKDLTDNKQYTFNYTSNGNYVFNITPADTIAKVNHSYELNVTIDGVLYTSTTTQKRPAICDTIYTEPVSGFNTNPADSLYNCILLARDKADNVADYYWLRTFRNDSLIDGSDELNFCIDGTGGAVTNASSEYIYFTPPATFLNFKEFKVNTKCGVEVHAITRENYFFFVQALGQISNGGLFATTPENVKTNIVSPTSAKTKAIGRFSMASVSTFSIIVKPE